MAEGAEETKNLCELSIPAVNESLSQIEVNRLK